MNMIATVATKEKAWQLADKLFPTDYSRNEPDSLRAGYPIFNTTSTDSKYKGFHISDLNAALELNMGAETIRINISEYETKPALEKADKTDLHPTMYLLIPINASINATAAIGFTSHYVSINSLCS